MYLTQHDFPQKPSSQLGRTSLNSSNTNSKIIQVGSSYLPSQYHPRVTDWYPMQAPSTASQPVQTSHIPRSSKHTKRHWSRLLRGLRRLWSLGKAPFCQSMLATRFMICLSSSMFRTVNLLAALGSYIDAPYRLYTAHSSILRVHISVFNSKKIHVY